MKSIYDVDGNKYNSLLESTMLWKTRLATMNCSSDLSTPNNYRWGEEVSGSTETPFTDITAMYNITPSQADCRIITYEDSSPVIENNKVWFSMSTQRGYGSCGAIICEYDIGTCKIKMTGAVIAYYDGESFSATGNSIMYNRISGRWLLLTHSTDAKGHILLKSESISDPRFGITTAYYEYMDYQNPGAGDEDQFVFYSSELNKWVMIYGSIRNNDANYLLRMQTSDSWDSGYTFYREVNDSSVLKATGVHSTIIGGVRYVLSGSSATGVNRHLVYSFPDLEYVGELNLDYGTGALKGVWPILFPITDCMKTKYYLFTFDRAALITDNVWSYGCLYLYCAEETNEGMEFPIKRDGLTIYKPITPTYSVTQLHFKRKWALREPMNLEIPLSEIKLEQAVLYEQSNMYPVIGSVGVTQSENGMYLSSAGSGIIVGGEHNPFSAYRVRNDWVQGSDKRALVIMDNTDVVKMRVSITKDGKVYGYDGNAETLLGTMRDESRELIICTSKNAVNIFEK